MVKLQKPGSPRQSWPITKQNGNNKFQHFFFQPTKCWVQNNEISTCLLAVKSFGFTAWTWLLNFSRTLLMVNFSDFNDLRVKWARDFKLFRKTVWTVCAWRIWILRLNCQLLLALQQFLHLPKTNNSKRERIYFSNSWENVYNVCKPQTVSIFPKTQKSKILLPQD